MGWVFRGSLRFYREGGRRGSWYAALVDEPVTLQPLHEDDLDELDEAALRGAGLTAEEIAASPEMGSWAGDDIESGAEYVEKIRRASPGYSWCSAASYQKTRAYRSRSAQESRTGRSEIQIA
jgi:hypothetical protein